MRRVGILVTAVAALAALVVYLGDPGGPGGEPERTLPRPLLAGGPPRERASKITLLGQELGAYGAWTTTRRVSVSCEAHRNVRGSVLSLCQALRYYASHLPTRPCLVHGGLTVTRVVISGELGGRSPRLRIGSVCNPPPALAQAVQKIYVAAFNCRARHHTSARNRLVPLCSQRNFTRRFLV